jgi:hypothetical protein
MPEFGQCRWNSAKMPDSGQFGRNLEIFARIRQLSHIPAHQILAKLAGRPIQPESDRFFWILDNLAVI